jgi:hypothetical protein
VARAWPFEDKPEPSRRAKVPEDFLKQRGAEGSEAVVVRIGANDAQLVLVDSDGFWDRWVYHSMEEAQTNAEALGVPVHVGEYPEATRVRMNSYVRPASSFDAGAYPEQGHVGPVIEYPENRPRRLDLAKKEVDSASDREKKS